MAINFDTLPQENPFALPTPGLYKATIDDAEMRRNKNDATKPPYLNLKYKLTDMEGKSKGVMFDILSESDSPVVGYKIARFCRACGIPLQGQIELSDLAKIVKGKEIRKPNLLYCFFSVLWRNICLTLFSKLFCFFCG